MAYKIMVIASLDVGVVGGSAISAHVVDFPTRDEADAAADAVGRKDEEETYTQLEVVKLY